MNGFGIRFRAYRRLAGPEGKLVGFGGRRDVESQPLWPPLELAKLARSAWCRACSWNLAQKNFPEAPGVRFAENLAHKKTPLVRCTLVNFPAQAPGLRIARLEPEADRVGGQTDRETERERHTHQTGVCVCVCVCVCLSVCVCLCLSVSLSLSVSRTVCQADRVGGRRNVETQPLWPPLELAELARGAWCRVFLMSEVPL